MQQDCLWFPLRAGTFGGVSPQRLLNASGDVRRLLCIVIPGNESRHAYAMQDTNENPLSILDSSPEYPSYVCRVGHLFVPSGWANILVHRTALGFMVLRILLANMGKTFYCSWSADGHWLDPTPATSLLSDHIWKSRLAFLDLRFDRPTIFRHIRPLV